MKRFLLSITILLCAVAGANAQSYMNEWIDFNKTYFKFKVGATGVYRISQSQLSSMGIANADAAHFQLWRHGKQVPVYTSVANGAIPSNGFIEFWGEVNDGKWERRMYLEPSYQINDQWSVFTDTASYFLTVNTNAGENRRLVQTTNDLSSPLPAESYFRHNAALYYRNNLNLGYAAVIGNYVYSSVFDKGEGFTSVEFNSTSSLASTQSNLFVASSGGDATLRFSAAGRTLNTRTVQVWINGTNVANREMSFFNILNADVVDNIPLSLISSNAANIEFRSSTVDTLPQFNRLVVGMYELNYPRLFNFGGQTNFEFVMPASAGGNNLVIDNFNFGGSVAPVLYDLTNGLRITASIVSATQVRVVLPPSSVERKLVLVSLDGGNIRAIQGVTPRNFTNYTLTTNQGDYIIISNPLLYSDASGVNQVEQYRLYRSSAAGGAHNAKIYDVGEIIDQFGYGIKNNAFAIKNFLRMAYDAFSVRPSNCFIIGKGVVYTNYRSSESTSKIDQLNLVPTFGNPASDTYLASAEGSIVQRIPIGRLTVVNGNEIKAYLDKVKKYESLYDANSCVVQDELWKKNVIHVAGANDLLGEQIRFHLNQYGNVLKDTSFGATIHSLQKSGVAAVQTIVSANITRLFQEGFSLLTYFGHSSPSTLEYNLSDPSSYPSIGKYPILLVNGCQAGNMFLSDETRLTGNYIITEKWVLTPEKGAVAFIASTHLGVVNYLHLYTEEFYNQMARPEQNAETIGRIMANVNDTLSRLYSYNDYYVRMHLEEITLHGDPALRFYNKKKPDYAVEPAMVKISPEFISIAESKFDVNVKLVNTGKAMSDSVHIRITRLYPDGKSSVQFDKNIKRLSYSDSILLELPIDPFRDKGSNKIRVEIDPDNLLDEECETNNVVTKEFFIFEDEIRPVYPYDYSIINKQNITYYASTANPLGATRKYYFEIDTTRNFNSVLLKKDSVISVGGSISFKPAGINFNDSTVYYWRVGMVPDGISAILWNDFSFVYIPGSESGFNQSHYFQHKQSSYKYMAINPGNRLMTFDSSIRKVQIRTGIHPYHIEASLDVALDFTNIERYGCRYLSFQFYVFDGKTLEPMKNTYGGQPGLYNSLATCGEAPRIFFEYSYTQQVSRINAINFLNNVVKDGDYVVVTNLGSNAVAPTDTAALKSDQSVLGPGVSLYHTLKNAGFTQIDQFKSNVPMIFIFKKNDPSFIPQQKIGLVTEQINDVIEAPAYFTSGSVESPWFGPAKEWKELKWQGHPLEAGNTDTTSIDIIGRTSNGIEVHMATVKDARDTSLSFISPASFPYIKLRLNNKDDKHITPYQLDKWKISADYVPEGAIAPNVAFKFKDTLEVGEQFEFDIAFRNISETAFDSLKLKLIITDRNNAPHEISLPKKKPLVSGDSIMVSYSFNTKDFVGLNTLYLMVNPDDNQPEQFLFNNFIFKNFYVKPDNYKPWLDVTFDGAHILNRDIVSAKPHIYVQLKDDSRFLALDDTTGMKIQIRYPDNSLRDYKPQSDSVKFTAANLTSGNNSATIDIYPHFMQDGEYELIVTGSDKSGNKAGELEYKVAFQIINKPMISNLLNYPNPFTTATAFVFYITGSEIPQNMRIQIMTITGKVVREITKAELGPLRIGRNITEFKWDGTDQFGNKLANGIYLYRVITNHHGKSLDRYKAENDETDQYFNKGYGKMYLMR